MKFEGDLIINTLPAGVEIAIPRVANYLEAAYGSRTLSPRAGRGWLEEPGEGPTGDRLLHAQAIRQNELFLQAFR
jgi:hypothetical protein